MKIIKSIGEILLVILAIIACLLTPFLIFGPVMLCIEYKTYWFLLIYPSYYLGMFIHIFLKERYSINNRKRKINNLISD